MLELISLIDGLRPRDNGAAIVAFRKGEPLRQYDLAMRARAWRNAFTAADGQRFLIHSSDAFEFLSALIGAWQAGKCVLMPSDLQATSATQLGAAVDGVAGIQGGLVPGSPSGAQWRTLDPEAVSLEVFTSGSTGHPVSIPKCLRQLDREVAALSALDLGPADARALGTVSHQHMYGLMFRILLPLATGRPFEAVRLQQVQDLSQFKAPEGCVLVSSPAHLARLSIVSSRCPVFSVLSAGGPLDEDAARACRDVLGVVPTEIYGSSETGAVAWRRRASADVAPWNPLQGVEFREEEGVLHIRTTQLPKLDWFRSADRVVATTAGFQIAGRADRTVKLDEKRVSLDAVERIAMQSGLLAKARALVLHGGRSILAVAALPNAVGYALAEQGKRNLVDALLKHLRSAAELEVLPRSWRFVDPWPVTADGKTPASLLLERFDRRNPEFRVLSQDANACVVELWVSPTTPFFSGHFPQQSVLPGVAQIDWLVWLSQRLFGVRAGFAGLEAAKFRRVILPASRLHVHLENDPATCKTRYRIEHRQQICASGRIRWAGAA
jgi:3-hydroxymyristoyl/3-hydroxydecanoyl-(acyl carrier protein) dehydratase/acyl-CoA synthetase (AMP-forming)/AMP-acid ligase II